MWKSYLCYNLLIPLGITGGISLLFYDSLWGILLYPIVLFLVRKYWKEEKKRKEKENLSKEFLDALQVISTSMNAGSSLENAMKEAEKELKKEYERETQMTAELREMNQLIQLRTPVEKVLLEFGDRSGVEDIASFAEVVAFAKRSGGNLVQIIEGTMNKMRDKWEMTQEMEVLVAGKRLEQRIMDLVPFGILFYLKLSSNGYLDSLYHNKLGILFMTGCLLVYVFALWLARRILKPLRME